jgi:Glycosyl transferases group 1
VTGFGKTSRKFVLSDVWYKDEFPEIADALTEGLPQPLAKLLGRSAVLRALAMSIRGRHYPLLLTCWDGTGRVLALIEALRGKRRLVLLEFIDFDYQSKRGALARLYGLAVKHVLGPCLRRCVLDVQVFTAWEKQSVVEKYGLREDQVKLFSWPLSLGEIAARPVDAQLGQDMVFSSGRAACDWPTLFAAQKIGGWPLTVVCSDKDLPLVKSLNADGQVKVLSNIPKKDHDDLFGSATVYALCMKEKFKSSGQIRLASGIEAGVPVVASSIRGLDGYVIDGVTAVAVPPGDAQALSDAVSGLLRDPARRATLVQRAWEFARDNTRALYIARIVEMLEKARDSRGQRPVS